MNNESEFLTTSPLPTPNNCRLQCSVQYWHFIHLYSTSKRPDKRPGTAPTRHTSHIHPPKFMNFKFKLKKFSISSPHTTEIPHDNPPINQKINIQNGSPRCYCKHLRNNTS